MFNYEPTHDLEGMLAVCYRADPVLIDKYHVASEQGFWKCVERTVNDFELNGVQAYHLYKDGKFIGYFGDHNSQLTGFFILPEHRNSDTKREFWNTVVSHFGSSFKTAIFAKNVPAKKFLMKNNCKLISTVQTNDGEGLIFEYKENN